MTGVGGNFVAAHPVASCESRVANYEWNTGAVNTQSRVARRIQVLLKKRHATVSPETIGLGASPPRDPPDTYRGEDAPNPTRVAHQGEGSTLYTVECKCVYFYIRLLDRLEFCAISYKMI